MDLNELQSVKSRERQTAELQQLRESFYEEVGEYLDQLERERERAAEAADDPFSDPEVQRLTDDIETAKGTVESLYERRIGKVVKQASLEAADMGAETGGLTAEERDAFESIVATIERNRERVLDGVVAGEDVDAGAASADRNRDRSSEPPREDADDPVRAEADRDRDRDRPTEAVPDDDSTPVASDGRPDFEAEAAVLGEESGVDAADLMGDGTEGASGSGGEPSSERAPSSGTRSNGEPPPNSRHLMYSGTNRATSPSARSTTPHWEPSLRRPTPGTMSGIAMTIPTSHQS